MGKANAMANDLHDSTALVVGGAGLIGSHITDLLLAEGVREVPRVRQSHSRQSRQSRGRSLADPARAGSSRETSATAAGAAAVAGCDYRLSPGRHPHHALRRPAPGAASTCWSAGRSTCSRPRSRRGSRKWSMPPRPRSTARPTLPDGRESPPLQQPDALRRGEADERGDRPQLPRHVRPAERRPALLQRVRPAHGRDRGLHRGVHPLARVHRPRAPPQIHGDGSATMDFVLRRGHRPGQHPGDEVGPDDDVYNVASGKETSLLELWQAIQS